MIEWSWILAEHPTDKWIRIHVDEGNLLVVPAGIYHRFTLDTNEHVKVMRLFKVRIRSSKMRWQPLMSRQDEPKWQAHYRSAETDANPHRTEYLKTFGDGPIPVSTLR